VVAHEQEILARFILTSNDAGLDQEVMLNYYKEQSTVESAFKFIKDNSFHASEVYLENENRIAALAMIMVLCLMVYSITEWQFRNLLREKNISIRNQVGKPTQRPRAKWVYFLFIGVTQRQNQIERSIYINN
jgi:transposase